MKKELLQRLLQSPISRADIKLNDSKIINFGFDVHIITWNERNFTCSGGKDNNISFNYSNVKSVEVFE